MLNLALIGIDANTDNVLAAIREDGRYFVNAAYADTFECNVQFSMKHEIDSIYMQVRPLLKRTDIDVVYVASTVPHVQSVVLKALRAGKTVLIADNVPNLPEHGDLIRVAHNDREALAEELTIVANALTEPLAFDFDPVI
ncbi:hypothetical protein [Lacticaseibacillus sharpeae]|uniref:Gfo/Idh/MocA-like oxidoreductase N-terminal domain-containing protein n=1 Tax=Lacticaseibacillus sharpeae JCM 1186 = DSM 20505 TaxID=1291052 RepID=A0A0R1ZTK9_9LACO|nr:hypothetical protein [Lacticaseibacillus sharpeae]KRM54243.1 hypothetical protein FC18_GL000462 [Lacticaseibacillus sharpeae JCM 1186 = DSM 20505]